MDPTPTPSALVRTATTDPDPEVKRAAQKQLVAASSLGVARTILGGTFAEQLDLIVALTRRDPPPIGILPYVVAAIGTPTGPVGDDLRKVLDAVRRIRPRDAGIAVIAGVGPFVRDRARDATPRDVLAMLEWATGGGDGPLDLGAHADDYVAAAVAAMERLPAAGVEELQFAGGLEALLVTATGGGELARALVDRWITEPPTAGLILRRMFEAHDRRQRHGEDRALVRWLADAWDRLGGDAGFRDGVAHAVGQHRNVGGRDWFVDWVWSRFCERPDERAALYAAFEGWRDELIERRNATERSRRPGGASTVDHLRVWGAVDLERLGGVVEECARIATDAEWPAIVDAVFELAAGSGPARGDAARGALVGVCKLGHEVCNRGRDRDAPPPAIDAAVDRLALLGGAVIEGIRAEGLHVDAWFASRIEDLETSIRLPLEARARREAAVREQARRDDERRHQREQVEAEVRRAQAEAQQLREEAARRQAELMAALGRPTTGLGASAMPQLELAPLDTEPFFGGAMPTLLDYVRIMVRLQRGGDALAVFADHGLDPVGFATASQPWGLLVAQRADVRDRFTALLTATWS
jgi:hypothetical protein